MPVAEVKEAIKNGERLLGVSNEFTSLIKDCWNQNPRLRPTFETIGERLAFPTAGAVPSISYLKSSRNIKATAFEKFVIKIA